MIGRYSILGLLGEGAMGIVYRAYDPVLDREVAVKELRVPEGMSSKTHTDAIERFYTEARAAGRIQHPNVVIIHDVGEHNGQPYLAMEVLEGP